jgi:hypothetical protein
MNGLKTIALAVLLLPLCLGQAYAAVCGDVNASGTIDIVDALLIAQYYVGANPAGFDPSVADVNGSGGVDIVDALRVAQYYVGLVTQLSCPGSTPVPTIAPTSPPAANGDPYVWPTYNPNISYDFRTEYSNLSMPTQNLNDCPGVAGTQSSEWWTFNWGSNKNSLVTPAAMTPMLQRLNRDFAYFRDTMGWPPDKRPQRGYRSAVYLYGSGLCTDSASNTDTGGWQSAINYNGESWPMALLSYYPVYCFDPACTYGDKTSQQGAVVHEGIHCILATMPGVKNAAWFHEGGNTWLQQEATARQTNNHSSMGFLNGTNCLAPFMPIECYSGWLQDDSFGGPSAEGVNMNNGSQQICTWRTYLGGVQYSNVFPTFLGMIWRNCPGRVLEGMAAGLGEQQLRRLIIEYRAKQALLDMGQWSGALASLLDAHFGQSIGAEWQPSWLSPAAWTATPYAKTTNSGGVLTPEYRTTPGWSGANQIPLLVSGGNVTVNFQPIGANMTCQLAYRATDGSCVYSKAVSSGDCTLRLDKSPNNGVVIVVVTNTDYVYRGDTTRKAHYDYRLQLGQGVTGTADINTKWYNAPGVRSAATSSLPATRSAGTAVVSKADDTFNSSDFDISKYCSRSFTVGTPVE